MGQLDVDHKMSSTYMLGSRFCDHVCFEFVHDSVCHTNHSKGLKMSLGILKLFFPSDCCWGSLFMWKTSWER